VLEVITDPYDILSQVIVYSILQVKQWWIGQVVTTGSCVVAATAPSNNVAGSQNNSTPWYHKGDAARGDSCMASEW
jgi:hypothetical protein